MKIAITGSSGFVGRHLSQLLAREGHELVPVSRRTGIDITKIPALSEAFAGCEVVVHSRLSHSDQCRSISRSTHHANGAEVCVLIWSTLLGAFPKKRGI